MSLPVLIGVLGALVGTLLASFSLGIARTPAWRHFRVFAGVAITAAGYSLFDLAMLTDLSASVIARCVQIALGFGALHAVAWLRYLAALEARPLKQVERWLSVFGVLLALGALWPGLLMTREIVTVRVSWLGVSYRAPQPTVFGGLAILYFCVTMFVALSVLGARRWTAGGTRRVAIVGVCTLTLLAVNDVLASAGATAMPQMFDAGALTLVLIVGIMHQWVFTGDAAQLQAASSRLADAVALRTQELLEAQAKLARAERVAGFGRVAGGVAHEINNPIAVIVHNLERLRGEVSTGPATRAIDTSLGAAERIAQLARQLLTAGRGTSLQPPRLVHFAVAPAVERALRTVRADVAQRQGSIDVQAEVPQRLWARGDAESFEQVLVSVLENAVDALEDPSGRQGRIRVVAQRIGERVRIVVRDNGPGIAPAVRDRLFEPFVSTKVVGRGTGLGLAASLGRMRDQHGDLQLLETSTDGTAMLVELPAADEAPTALGPPEPAKERRDLRLLIIDDDEDLRVVLGLEVELYFTVILAGTVADAVATATREPVDAVLCDIMMPDGGASLWLERARAIDPRLPERTILMSGGLTSERATALVDAYKGRVLCKPFDIDALRILVERVALQRDAVGERRVNDD